MADMVTRQYSGFLGLDLREENLDLRRSPDCMNMWRDYKDAAGIRTRPGMKRHTAFPEKVNGIYFLKGQLIAHCGGTLYAVTPEETVAIGSLADHKSQGFVFDQKLYILDGTNYLCYDGMELKEVVGYIPTTSIGRDPAGGGTVHEDVNYLSAWRINTFCGNGESTEFHLDAEDIEADVEVTVDGKSRTVKQVVTGSGVVVLNEAPPAPGTPGQDNVVIKFRKAVEGYADRVKKSTMVQMFDNRVFLSGHPDYPNRVIHCSLEDPTYFSDQDYYDEGLDPAKVTGMAAGNNALWVFREPSDANTTVYYHTPTLDETYGKIYPSSHSSVTTGCIGKAINFNDDIVFFSERGMEGISSDITTEQVLGHRSSLVDSGITAEKGYRDMILEEWEGYLLVIMGKTVYLADSRAKFANGNHVEYEWFRWELDKAVTCARVQDGVLYFGTEKSIYTLTDAHKSVESWWVTPKDRFGYPNYLKTTNKRGCTVEATGDIEIQAKTEKTDFVIAYQNECVEDYIVPRIKQKKFKDLQLKFYSPSRFSLESVTLECFIGGYIKR